ncbi:MAG TPA: site-specific integrase [Anaerohalosphaeraceae bacterium]|nr:site-specific integrase [Anaerohalosphaeraceae bacterium]
MASVVKKITISGPRYYIKLSPGENSQRPSIHFGTAPKKQVESALVHINNLINHKNTGHTLSIATQEWLEGISDGLRDRLESLGLVERQKKSKFTLLEWANLYIEQRTQPKTDTRRKLENVRDRIKAFFKNDILADITPYQCKNYRRYLLETVELSENTTRRHIGMCRQIINGAIDAGLIQKNPFLGQPVTVQPNPSRFFYVGVDLAQKVLDAMPDAEWRLIFGLVRWGGLRCPSEVVALRWNDVDFEKNRFIVRSPKTAHHIGHEQRTVPMFPELRPLFQDAYDAAPEGSVYCVNRYKGGKEVNLRTQFERILEKSKIVCWKKPFQNCRSTRETELFKMTGGNVKAVCSWIGNSPEIAMKHYAQICEADMKQAAEKAVLGNAEKKAKSEHQNSDHEHHKKHQHTPAEPRTDSHESNEDIAVSSSAGEDLRNSANQYENKTKNIQWAEVDSNHRRR